MAHAVPMVRAMSLLPAVRWLSHERQGAGPALALRRAFIGSVRRSASSRIAAGRRRGAPLDRDGRRSGHSPVASSRRPASSNSRCSAGSRWARELPTRPDADRGRAPALLLPRAPVAGAEGRRRSWCATPTPSVSTGDRASDAAIRGRDGGQALRHDRRPDPAAWSGSRSRRIPTPASGISTLVRGSGFVRKRTTPSASRSHVTSRTGSSSGSAATG